MIEAELHKLCQVRDIPKQACWVCVCILWPQTQWQDLIPDEVSVTRTELRSIWKSLTPAPGCPGSGLSTAHSNEELERFQM